MSDHPEQLLRHIRRLLSAPDGDAALLDRFIRRRDEDAFASLVHRHGPMVQSVCRRVLGDAHACEDAAQAVFLVLARKAATIRPPERLAAWLHGVARQVALNVRREDVRRRRRETLGAQSSPGCRQRDPLEELSARELLSILDEELQRLPEVYRLPLILCNLEGCTMEEAAARLGWTPGSIRGRLLRGRKQLHARLARRGLALSAALAILEASRSAVAGSPMVRIASVSADGISARAMTLAEGAIQSMAMAKLKVGVVLGLTAGLVMAGAGVAHQVLRAERPNAAVQEHSQPEAAAERSVKPKEEHPSRTDRHGDSLPVGAITRLGTVRFNHGAGLNTLLFSKDGKMLFSEGGGLLRIWDAATGQERELFPTSQHGFESQMVLMPDGETLLSLNQEVQDVVRVWDIARKKEVRTLSLPVQRLESSVTRRNALSADGSLGAINLPSDMRVFDLSTGRELYKLAKGGKDIRDVVFAGSDQLVTADAKQIIDVWQAHTGKHVRRFAHKGPAEVLATSPDGRWLATFEHHTYAIDRYLDKDVIHLWDLKTGTKKHDLTARPKRWFMRMRFSPDGKRLVASSSGGGAELTVWDVETGERLREIRDLGGMSFAFSPAGDVLAIVHDPGKFDLWDVKTSRCLTATDPRHARASAAAFSPAGDRVVLLGYSSISVWDSVTGRRRDTFELPLQNHIPPMPALSSDGRFALNFTGEGQQSRGIIWGVAQHRRLQTLNTSGQRSVFSPDSSLLASWESGKDSLIRLRDVATGREVRSFPAGNMAWPNLFFTADGKSLITAGDKIAGYDVTSGKELFSWKMKPVPDHSGSDIAVGNQPADGYTHRAWRGITVSPNGELIAVTLDGGFGLKPLRDRIALFDAQTGRLIRRWSDSGQPSSSYEQLVFSHDIQLLATSDNEVVHVWETATGKEIRSFRSHRGEIDCLVFSHDHRRLLSVSRDSTGLIWDLTGRVGGSMTDATKEEGWQRLIEDDARLAQEAVWALALKPDQSIPLLKGYLKPVKAVNREQMDRWIKELDSEQFELREKAARELEQLGELAEPALRRALQAKPTLEQRRRIEPILTKLEAALPTGEALRSLRAVRVLEQAGTAEARDLLRQLAGGAEGARMTRAAAAALERQARRSR